MAQLISGWQEVLTNWVNQIYQKNYLSQDLIFKQNTFYTPTYGRKVIDVFPANDKNVNRGLINIHPYGLESVFLNIPIVLYADNDSTGSELIDILSANYGITFDKDIDFKDEFLKTVYQIDETARKVTIEAAPTSMIWSGEITVVTMKRGNNLNSEIVHRELEGLAISDTVTPGTQSLRLTTEPLVIVNPALVTQFSDPTPLVITDNNLDMLIGEFTSQGIVPPDYPINEIRDILNGKTLISVEDAYGKCDRYRETESVINSPAWSGKPRFKFKSVEIPKDVGNLIGEIVFNNLPFTPNQKLLDFLYSSGKCANVFYLLIEPQLQLFPEKRGYITQTVYNELQKETTWSEMRRDVTSTVLNHGKATIYLETSENSPLTGSIPVTFIMPDITIGTEEGTPITTEDGSDVLDIEVKTISLTTDDGTLNIPYDQVPIDSLSLEDTALLGLMLYTANKVDDPTLKTTVVATPTDNGTIYTEPFWSGVEVHVTKKA